MMSDAKTIVTIELEIKEVEGLPAPPVVHFPAKQLWYIALEAGPYLNNKTKPSHRVGNSVTWNESYRFQLPSEFVYTNDLQISLFRANSHLKDKRVAIATGLSLLEMSCTREYIVKLESLKPNSSIIGHLTTNVEILLPTSGQLSDSSPSSALIAPNNSKTLPSLSESWRRFFEVFRRVSDIAIRISELNGAAKAAIGTIQFAITVVIEQIERDERVKELLDTMTTLLSFYFHVNSLQTNDFLQSVLRRLLLQATECTRFLVAYKEIESFAQRAVISLARGTDSTITQFFTSFKTIQAELALGTSLQTVYNTDYILNKVDEINNFQHINHLQPLLNSSWLTKYQCPTGEWDFTLDRLHSWISQPSPTGNLFLLVGRSNAGKSTILHTLAKALFESRRLGACIFLNPETEGKKDSTSILRTIVHYLARSFPQIGERVAEEIKRRPLLDSVDAPYYGEFLARITGDLVVFGPIVLIVDGVHELGNPRDERLVFSVLGKLARLGHPNLRFIMSSRTPPESTQEKLDPDSKGEDGFTNYEWRINRFHSPLSDTQILIPDSFPELLNLGLPNADRKALVGNLSSLIHHSWAPSHVGSMMKWFTIVHRFLTSIDPKVVILVIQSILSSIPTFDAWDNVSPSEEHAIDRFISIISGGLSNISNLDVFYSDFIYLPRGSKLFLHVPPYRGAPNSWHSNEVGEYADYLGQQRLFPPGFLVAVDLKATLALKNFIVYSINDVLPPNSSNQIMPVLPRMLPANVTESTAYEDDDGQTARPPDSDLSVNIYRVCLRPRSSFGPVYARIAVPGNENLSDTPDIQNHIGDYTVYPGDFERMLKKSPSGGCEWFILHHKFHPVVVGKGGQIQVTATTPVFTEAILERLVCIWVNWSSKAKEGVVELIKTHGEHLVLELIWRDTFTDVFRKRAGVFLNCRERVVLEPGDQLQVTALYHWAYEDLRAMIGLALRY